MLYARRGEEKAAWERAVDTFSVLGDRRRQIAGTLSGGEQQMLALVRAYVSDPRIVLVDEASLGLAPLIVDSIFEFLEKIAQRRRVVAPRRAVRRAARSRWRPPSTC